MRGMVLGLAGGLGLAAFPSSREERRWGVFPNSQSFPGQAASSPPLSELG